MPTLNESVDTLTAALADDPDYRQAWKSNIAMAFKDAFAQSTARGKVARHSIHAIANDAAEHFLTTLTSSPRSSSAAE